MRPTISMRKYFGNTAWIEINPRWLVYNKPLLANPQHACCNDYISAYILHAIRLEHMKWGAIP